MLVAIEMEVLSKMQKGIAELNEYIKTSKKLDINTEILETEQACEYLKLSKRTVQILRDKGEIKFSQYGSKILYKRSDLERFIDSCRVGKR